MASRNSNHLSVPMAPIDRAGITELVVQRIKDLLERGDLKAGSRLPPERDLADMLSISRPSLRTALKALPPTGVRFMHIGPSALARAKSGDLELSYLFRPVAPVPRPGPVSLPVLQAPAGTVLEPEDRDD